MEYCRRLDWYKDKKREKDFEHYLCVNWKRVWEKGINFSWSPNRWSKNENNSRLWNLNYFSWVEKSKAIDGVKSYKKIRCERVKDNSRNERLNLSFIYW